MMVATCGEKLCGTCYHSRRSSGDKQDGECTATACVLNCERHARDGVGGSETGLDAEEPAGWRGCGSRRTRGKESENW